MVWTSGNIILGIVDCSFIEVKTTGNNLKALFDKIENLIRFDFLKFDQKLFLIHFFFFFLFFLLDSIRAKWRKKVLQSWQTIWILCKYNISNINNVYNIFS